MKVPFLNSSNIENYSDFLSWERQLINLSKFYDSNNFNEYYSQ